MTKAMERFAADHAAFAANGGGAAPGFSSGQAIAEMEAIAARALPQGMSFAWTGLSLEEIKAGKQENLYDPRRMITSGPGFVPLKPLG